MLSTALVAAEGWRGFVATVARQPGSSSRLPFLRLRCPTSHHPSTPPRRRFNKSAGQSNFGLQSPVPACHFWADHRYRLLYVRNFKTAGTSISITLGQKELPMYCT